MTSELQTGLLLLLVGMITVFTVLGIVVVTGKGLVVLLNYTGKDIEKKFNPTTNKPARVGTPSKESTDKRKIAAVIAATMITTKGKGQIREIQRIQE